MLVKKVSSAKPEACMIDAMLSRAVISPERREFLAVLKQVKGLSAEDQNKYAKLLDKEKVRGIEQLAKLDAAGLKQMGIPMGDAMEIVDVVRNVSISKLMSDYSSSNMSLTDSMTEDDVTVPALPEGVTFYGFASHNWGTADTNFLNHARTAKLIDRLKALGVPIWFDHDRLKGAIESQITRGIDTSATFLVFVTRDYIEKVISGSDSDTTDWCHYEFLYAGQQKPNKMIAVVMEGDMLDTKRWKGPVGARLGGKVFADFSSDDKLDSCASELARIISSMM